jgi:hypothetical protein
MMFELEWRTQDLGVQQISTVVNPLFLAFFSVYTLNKYCVDCRNVGRHPMSGAHMTVHARRTAQPRQGGTWQWLQL